MTPLPTELGKLAVEGSLKQPCTYRAEGYLKGFNAGAQAVIDLNKDKITFTLRPSLKEDFEYLVEANAVLVGDVINTAIEEYIKKRTEKNDDQTNKR